MSEFKNILVIQTAFLGDVILTTPVLQLLHQAYPDAGIDILVVPRAAEVLTNHPAIRRVISYDKRGAQRGASGFLQIALQLRDQRYDLGIVPHRSLRSAALARVAGIGRVIGFDKSAARFLYTDIIHYRESFHEVERNISLLSPLGIHPDGRVRPSLYPGESDVKNIELLLNRIDSRGGMLVGVAPGSIWNTKRWLAERFADLCRKLGEEKINVFLIGGKEDSNLCNEIAAGAKSDDRVVNTAGSLRLLESAELIRRCNVLVTNDSAPMHLASAMGTKVVAIYGPTLPEFGFAPYGDGNAIAETMGLECRPCSIHGGDRCPIGTFDCMERISTELVFQKVMGMLTGEKV